MRILLINCQSIKAPAKKAQLENMISSTQAGIVIGTESWLNNNINSSEVFPPNFKAYRRDRQKGHGGGVFILVADKYTSEEPEELSLNEDCEAVWSRVKIKGAQDLCIGSFYKPPSKTDPHYLDLLQSVLTRIPRTAHLWLGGDFNLADINWDNECPAPHANNKTQCQQLIDICKNTYLEQIVDQPTRVTEYTSNLLDLFFTNNKTLINKCEVLPGIADHEAVFIESSLRPMKVKKHARKVHIYKKAEYDKMRDNLSSYKNFAEDSQNMNANDSWNIFEKKIKELINKHIPSKTISGNRVKKPWIDKAIRSKHKLLKKLYSKLKKSSNPKDRQNYINVRNQTQKLERNSYWRYVENLIDEDTPDVDQQPSKQKKFWNYIKSLRKDNLKTKENYIAICLIKRISLTDNNNQSSHRKIHHLCHQWTVTPHLRCLK